MPNRRLGLFTEPGYVAGDFQPGLHRPADIVFMSFGVTEHNQQPVTMVSDPTAARSGRRFAAPARGSGPPAADRFPGSTRVDNFVESTRSAKSIVSHHISPGSSDVANRSSASTFPLSAARTCCASELAVMRSPRLIAATARSRRSSIDDGSSPALTSISCHPCRSQVPYRSGTKPPRRPSYVTCTPSPT